MQTSLSKKGVGLDRYPLLHTYYITDMKYLHLLLIESLMYSCYVLLLKKKKYMFEIKSNLILSTDI